MMATWCLSEASRTRGNDGTMHILPRPIWHEPSSSTGHGITIDSTNKDLDATSGATAPETTASLLPPTATMPHRKLWMYREQLISLYWIQDLPLREVQDIMKREYGLDASDKVYKHQFRRWGIRKNIKRHEALELAMGQDSSSMFWPDIRDEEYASRIDRHLKKSTHRSNSASTQARTWIIAHSRQLTKPPRRLRGPDTLEKIEMASYYFHVYMTSHHEMDTWYHTGPHFEEQEIFSAIFIRGLERLSRDDQQHLAFKDINHAFDYLKLMVERNHPLVYIRLMATAGAFIQYPKSEICKSICRSLSDYVRKLSLIIHGTSHPLNHTWGDVLHLSSAEGPESFVLGVGVDLAKQCMARKANHAMGFFDIAECVPSDARGLDEASLRGSLMEMASRPDLVSKAQETRLALSELLLNQSRIAEGYHFYTEAMSYQDVDPLRRASKAFWTAELKWRAGNTWASIYTLESALECAEAEPMEENGTAGKLKEQIFEVLRRRRDLVRWSETNKYVQIGNRSREICS